jgi:hypothetical protein
MKRAIIIPQLDYVHDEGFASGGHRCGAIEVEANQQI